MAKYEFVFLESDNGRIIQALNDWATRMNYPKILFIEHKETGFNDMIFIQYEIEEPISS